MEDLLKDSVKLNNSSVILQFLSFCRLKTSERDIVKLFNDKFIKNLSFDMAVRVLNFLQSTTSLIGLNQTANVFTVSPSQNDFSLQVFDTSSIENIIEYIFIPDKVSKPSVACRCYLPKELFENVDKYVVLDCSIRMNLSLLKLTLINLVDGKPSKNITEKSKIYICELTKETSNNEEVFIGYFLSETKLIHNPIVFVCETKDEVCSCLMLLYILVFFPNKIKIC
jgi:hypothetical protein